MQVSCPSLRSLWATPGYRGLVANLPAKGAQSNLWGCSIQFLLPSRPGPARAEPELLLLSQLPLRFTGLKGGSRVALQQPPLFQDSGLCLGHLALPALYLLSPGAGAHSPALALCREGLSTNESVQISLSPSPGMPRCPWKSCYLLTQQGRNNLTVCAAPSTYLPLARAFPLAQLSAGKAELCPVSLKCCQLWLFASL